MSKSIEKIILDQAANYAAKLATNRITVFLQRWRFYFDDHDRAKLNEEVKKMLLEVVENAVNRKF
jgi:hypothetical protein